MSGDFWVDLDIAYPPGEVTLHDFGVLTEADVAMVRWALTSQADELDYSGLYIDDECPGCAHPRCDECLP